MLVLTIVFLAVDFCLHSIPVFVLTSQRVQKLDSSHTRRKALDLVTDGQKGKVRDCG